MSRRSYYRMGETQSALPEPGSPYALNDRLAKTEYIGLGEVEGPEDVIVDRTTTSIAAPGMARSSASSRPTTRDRKYSHISAASRSAWHSTATATCSSCVGAMGLYKIISQKARSTKLTAETNRTWLRSSTMRACAIPTISTWLPTAGFSSPMRPPLRRSRMGGGLAGSAGQPGASSATIRATGRDAQRILAIPLCQRRVHAPMTASRSSSRKPGPAACTAIGSTGRRRAHVECVIKDMPGYPDNINRASDGTYWMALARHAHAGLRSRLAHARHPQAHDVDRMPA